MLNNDERMTHNLKNVRKLLRLREQLLKLRKEYLELGKRHSERTKRHSENLELMEQPLAYADAHEYIKQHLLERMKENLELMEQLVADAETLYAEHDANAEEYIKQYLIALAELAVDDDVREKRLLAFVDEIAVDAATGDTDTYIFIKRLLDEFLDK